MRVQCDVCEQAPAEVVCCADEAVLCLSCDQKVHAANKLASKHQRLRLLHNLPDNSNPLPLCDICQEKDAFIFCLEDRALLCRDCDVCIHAANTLAARHQRFLATGIQVALESELHPLDDGLHPSKPEAPQPPSCTSHAVSPACTNYSSSCSIPSKRTAGKESRSTACRHGVEDVAKPAEEWNSIKRLDLEGLASDYPLGDIDFSKTDVVALGDQDWLTDICGFDEPLCSDSLAEVPQASGPMFSAAVQELDSSTKFKHRRECPPSIQDFDSISVVPDLTLIGSHAPLSKRQKSVFSV